MDKDGSARAKAIPKRPQGKVPSPVHTDFQGTPWSKMPPLVRATTAPKESDIPSPVAPSDDAAGKPPVAAKSVPFNPAPSPVLPEAGDESGPTPESRVAVAQPAAPIQLEVPTVPALVRHQEEDRTDGNQRQPELRQAAIAEGPKVQIGLLEVVVLAPDRGSHETPPAANARSNFASRHYLRNV
jgi:hypothetical protein